MILFVDHLDRRFDPLFEIPPQPTIVQISPPGNPRLPPPPNLSPGKLSISLPLQPGAGSPTRAADSPPRSALATSLWVCVRIHPPHLTHALESCQRFRRFGGFGPIILLLLPIVNPHLQLQFNIQNSNSYSNSKFKFSNPSKPKAAPHPLAFCHCHDHLMSSIIICRLCDVTRRLEGAKPTHSDQLICRRAPLALAGEEDLPGRSVGH